MHQNQTPWELPNPFIKPDGTMVRTVEEWPQQQAYLKQILAEDLYGVMPPAPGNVTAEKKYEQSLWNGAGIFESYELSFGPDNKVHMRTVLIRQAEITVPQIPIILCGGYVAEPIARMVVEQGRVLAIPFCDDAAPDEPGYRSGSLYQAYPDYSFKVIAMWGWLMSRVADWLETLPCVDISKLVVSGHSRFGKAALACAVFDERVQVCAAGGSGCGGIGSLRLGGGRYGEGHGAVETLGGMITGYFPHWFLESLVPFGAKEASAHYRENELRFDANFIGAAIAPRGLILVEGLDDTWANPFGTAASWSATSEVYHFLKADEKCAIHFREGGHDLNQEDWQVLLDFVSVQLEGAKKQSNYKTYTPADPMVGRNWKAPVEEEEKPAAEGFTPEQIASLKAMLSNRWAFGDAGLETGMHRFIKAMIAKAEEQQS